MPLIPNVVPGVAAPQVAVLLQARWTRARLLLRWSAVVLPWTVAASCAVQAVLAGSWWAAAPAVGAVLPAAVRTARLRHDVLDPPSWLPTAFLVAGGQLLLGAIPAFGWAYSSASGAARTAAGLLFVAVWVCAGTSCALAHRAHRGLLTPVVPALGATGFALVLPVRFALVTPDLASARLRLGTDRVTWSARLHRGRGAGPAAEHGVPWGDVRDVVVVDLPHQTPPRIWLTLPDGSVLHAPAGPAVLLRTARGDWMVPVHDGHLVRDLLLTRRHRWAGRPPGGPANTPRGIP
ncbi:hypothetical protein [Saccharothrix yanglingensis]|uniref:Uncharacterized protein n=1 Tax=Saccharothrix yanglingensis TaxID=659496 RepID=A0ABU0X4V2_9PSEU|nr:hypothetical protein [Saccharothrix yanglingensis]MDQ2586743.1 hypothetical protein [Saccharothrix yanglingensis]